MATKESEAYKESLSALSDEERLEIKKERRERMKKRAAIKQKKVTLSSDCKFKNAHQLYTDLFLILE